MSFTLLVSLAFVVPSHGDFIRLLNKGLPVTAAPVEPEHVKYGNNEYRNIGSVNFQETWDDFKMFGEQAEEFEAIINEAAKNAIDEYLKPLHVVNGYVKEVPPKGKRDIIGDHDKQVGDDVKGLTAKFTRPYIVRVHVMTMRVIRYSRTHVFSTVDKRWGNRKTAMQLYRQIGDKEKKDNVKYPVIRTAIHEFKKNSKLFTTDTGLEQFHTIHLVYDHYDSGEGNAWRIISNDNYPTATNSDFDASYEHSVHALLYPSKEKAMKKGVNKGSKIGSLGQAHTGLYNRYDGRKDLVQLLDAMETRNTKSKEKGILF